jgi:hypothetical protein
MNPNPNHLPDPPVGFPSEYRTAVAAAEEAGASLRSRVPDGFAARPKGELGDVVTDLDLMAERLVRNGLPPTPRAAPSRNGDGRCPGRLGGGPVVP